MIFPSATGPQEASGLGDTDQVGRHTRAQDGPATDQDQFDGVVIAVDHPLRITSYYAYRPSHQCVTSVGQTCPGGCPLLPNPAIAPNLAVPKPVARQTIGRFGGFSNRSS